MILFSLLAAILLPWVLGVLLVNLLLPRGIPARVMLLVGYGVLAGLVTVPLLMRGLDALGLSIHFSTVAIAVGLLLVALLPLQFRLPGRVDDSVPQADLAALSAAGKLCLLLVIALLALRFFTLGAELLGRPLFPWDATMHWATKARVWFEHGSIVPFVENHRWLRMAGEGVYTDHHPGYPITIPLLQVWMTSAVGSWDESLMNLPWLLCLLGLGMAFYGQLRLAGVGTLVAACFTYMLLSMPLPNTHVALAGYADLFLGAAYGAALMAFYNWSVTRQAWQGLLALLFATACLLIKNEGFYWFLTFIPGLVAVLLPPRRAALVFAAMSLGLIAALLLIPEDFVVAGHSLKSLNLYYREGSAAAIATSFLVHDNWHLLPYLLLAVLPLAFLPGNAQQYRGVAIALAGAVCLFLVLFTMTKYAIGATRFTAVGRISMHLVPGIFFLVALLGSQLMRGEGRRSNPGPPVSPAS